MFNMRGVENTSIATKAGDITLLRKQVNKVSLEKEE
jgi:hypothetical protein